MERTKSIRWVFYFVILTSLVAIAVTLPILYNLEQQLRPEQLNEARLRWREAGPADYDLTFSIRYDREPLAERHIVLVRDRAIVFASCEGEPAVLARPLATLIGLPAGGLARGRSWDVPALFERIEQLLKEQPGSERQNFLVAVFDPRTGHPRRFIRRVRGTSTREEWDILLWPAGKLGASRR